MSNFIQLMSKDITTIREQILKEQNGKCKLCKNIIDENSGASLDHQHMTSKETIGENGAGLVRGVLCRRCNVFEGKIWNNSKRFGLHDDLSNWLRNLADYLDADNYDYIHPNEKPKDPKVSKRNYNKLAKLYKEEVFVPKRKNQKKKPMIEFPKSGKLNKGLKELFERFEINPFN